MRGALTGGLGGIGFGLTWMGLEGMMGRVSPALAVVLLATAALSLGMAFSDSHLRTRAPWGLATLLGILGLVAFGLDVPGWYAALILLFAVAYAYLGLFVHWQSHPPHLPHFRRARARA